MPYKNFFWLHIKKAGGISTRAILAPHYKVVDKVAKPANFIQSEPEEYNDILNNFRVVLGEYQFKRAHFAKEFLYKENWESLYSFAFSREPMDRCLNMFHYLFQRQKDPLHRKIIKIIKDFKGTLRFGSTMAYDFDVFLDFVAQSHNSEVNNLPFDLHFTTHVAPMWDDITDFEGDILLTKIYRLEDQRKAIQQVFEICGIKKTVPEKIEKRNVSKNATNSFVPSKEQRLKVQTLFSKDFELYEKASF